MSTPSSGSSRGTTAASSLYEARWRFIDEETLTPKERELTRELTQRWGAGVLNA